MKIPEYIVNIPTDKKATTQRREIIKNSYLKLLERLKRENQKGIIYNEFLGVDVYIIMRESAQKASNSGAYSWQSTYAITKLEKVIKNASNTTNEPIYVSAKMTGKQKEFKYVNMAILYYTFNNSKYDYMNFTVKLTLGVKNDGRHIQYSVDKIDYIKKIIP